MLIACRAIIFSSLLAFLAGVTSVILAFLGSIRLYHISLHTRSQVALVHDYAAEYLGAEGMLLKA